MKLKGISALLICTGLSCIYSSLLNSQLHKESFAWWQSLIFFIALFIILSLVYFIKTDVKTFAGILLAAGVAKFILCSVFALIYFLTLKGGFFNFFLHFIGHYVLFTVFEIRYLLQLIKTTQK